MRKKGSHYSNDEKYHFIRLYHESGMSKAFPFCKLHGISSASQLRYLAEKVYSSFRRCIFVFRSCKHYVKFAVKKITRTRTRSLKKRIKELEKALRPSLSWKTEARDLVDYSCRGIL